MTIAAPPPDSLLELVNASALACAIHHRLRRKYGNKPAGKKFVIKKRKRRTVSQVHHELGDYMFRRSYRMDYQTFLRLYNTIRTDLFKCLDYNSTKRNAPNGRINPMVRLACALRIFAGGDAYDLITTYGISYHEVWSSVSHVISAVKSCNSLAIRFPTDHKEQEKIARGFRSISDANFSICVGAVDGILIWIRKPNDKQC